LKALADYVATRSPEAEPFRTLAVVTARSPEGEVVLSKPGLRLVERFRSGASDMETDERHFATLLDELLKVEVSRHAARTEGLEEEGQLTSWELARLLRALPPSHRLFFRFLGATGLRILEAVALRWRDLHLSGASPYVDVRRSAARNAFTEPKWGHSRKVPFDHLLVEALRGHRAARRSTSGDMVFAGASGAPLTPEGLRRVLEPAAERANLRWVNLHTFRAAYASRLSAEGVDAAEVERRLGHGPPKAGSEHGAAA
jgi:integrase